MIDQGIRYTEMSTGNDLEQIYPTHQVESVSEQQHHHKHWMLSVMLEYQEMSESVHQLLHILSISMVKSSTMDGIDLVEILVCTMKPMDEVSI